MAIMCACGEDATTEISLGWDPEGNCGAYEPVCGGVLRRLARGGATLQKLRRLGAGCACRRVHSRRQLLQEERGQPLRGGVQENFVRPIRVMGGLKFSPPQRMPYLSGRSGSLPAVGLAETKQHTRSMRDGSPAVHA